MVSPGALMLTTQAADTGGDTPLSRCLASATAETAAADAAIFKLLVDKGANMEVRKEGGGEGRGRKVLGGVRETAGSVCSDLGRETTAGRNRQVSHVYVQCSHLTSRACVTPPFSVPPARRAPPPPATRCWPSARTRCRASASRWAGVGGMGGRGRAWEGL